AAAGAVVAAAYTAVGIAADAAAAVAMTAAVAAAAATSGNAPGAVRPRRLRVPLRLQARCLI
ncbi:MAG: hypothetical protein ACK6D2_16370, partial [Planctomycetota bacterium]